MQNFSFCHSWLFRRVTKAKAVQGTKTWNKLNFRKVTKIIVGVVLNKRCHGCFSKMCSWKCSKNRFSITRNYFFPQLSFSKFKKMEKETTRFLHSTQFWFSHCKRNTIFATKLHVWDFCHKTPSSGHLAPGSSASHKALLGTRHSYFSATWRCNTMRPFWCFAPAPGEGEMEKKPPDTG